VRGVGGEVGQEKYRVGAGARTRPDHSETAAAPKSSHNNRITTEGERIEMSIAGKDRPNWRVHPGEILREEFLKPMQMGVYRLAKKIHVPTPRVNRVLGICA
jgi:hypothetical protein